jgi:hypothetical protein
MASFGLLEALLGRRYRRFFRGATTPDGVIAYKSEHEPLALSELEKMLVIAACGGNTSWHNLIYRGKNYAPHLSNYAGAAGGHVFPSAAGFQTRQTLFTGDLGHAASIALVAILVLTAGNLISVTHWRWFTAILLLTFGIYELFNYYRHPRWVGLRVSLRDLFARSFLMAVAHGAGLMVAPTLLTFKSHDI